VLGQVSDSDNPGHETAHCRVLTQTSRVLTCKQRGACSGVFIVRCANENENKEMSGSLCTLSHPGNAGKPPTARQCPHARMFIVYSVEMLVEL
jgi:hypothetical protein